MAQLDKQDIWWLVQGVLTVGSIILSPFTIALLLLIKHEMASHPHRFQIRKILLVTALVLQICVMTILRDQYIWSEAVRKEEQSPIPLMCGLARWLWYGIIEITVYYLFVALLWEETESTLITKKQLDPKVVETIKEQYEDRFFYLFIIYIIYTFCIAMITILPSWLIQTLPSPFQPDMISGHFLDGIDDYRCEMSNVANLIGTTNKIIFFILCLLSAIRLRNTQNTHYLSDTVACFVIIPLCTICNIFALCNEKWLNILSFDMGRAMGFMATVVMTVSMICNHLMMQAQAKQMIEEGMRRASGIVKSVRLSILGTPSIPINKVEPERTETVAKQRFSVPEFDADEYDPVMIEQRNDDQVIMMDHDDEEKPDNVPGEEAGAGGAPLRNDMAPMELEDLMEIHEQMKRESLEIMKSINNEED